MGMCACLAAITDATIERLRLDPPQVWRVVAPDDEEALAQAAAPSAPPRGLLARWFGRRVPPAPQPLVLAPGEGETIDLDKAWHGIHWLLTGSADAGAMPLDFLVGDGMQIGDVEVGYGPARAFPAGATRAIAAALAAVTDEALRARFDAPRMAAAEIYPEIWHEDESLDYVLEYVAKLRAFLDGAVGRGHGMLVWLS